MQNQGDGHPYQKSNAYATGSLDREVRASLEKDILHNKKSLLEWGEPVLAERCTPKDIIASLQLLAVRTDIDDNAGTVTADDGRPLVDKEARVLLHGLTMPLSAAMVF